MDLVFASEPGSVDPHTEVLYELLGSAIKHGVLHQAQIQSSNRKLRANEWHQAVLSTTRTEAMALQPN